MPGEYEYKFVCGGWADQENVPEECNDGNGDEYSNRLVVVDEGAGPIHLPPTQWGGCPELMVDQVMVTLWLDADGVPCEGNPYVAGSFNGWSATEIYMNYDEYYDQWSADISLDPGSYEYKFVCYEWADQETVPEECNDGNGDEYSNRLVVVEEGEEWVEVDVTPWSGCPLPDFCDVFDCVNKLHAIVLVDTSQYDFVNMEVRMTGPWWSWDPNGGPVATWQEFWDPEDAEDLGTGGFFHVQFDDIPTEEMQYLWVINGETELSQLLANDGLSTECVAYTDYYSYATRAWHPDDCAPDFYYDYDPNEDGCVFADFYGGCWEDDDETPDYATYLGEFDGHEFYAIDMQLDWYTASDSASDWGGHLATLTSPEENEFLRQMLDYEGIEGYYYIGLYDQNMDGTGWGWVTGEPLVYTNWAVGEPNGPGYENVGMFYPNGEWNDTDDMASMPFIVEFDAWPPEGPTITSYTYQVQTLDSYNNGDYATTVLPNVDVNDGLHTIATFDTVGIEGPYAGVYVLFFDSNFNGQLDSTDFNVLEWSGSDDFGNDENVMLLVDNGPNDMNPEIGVYETITYADSPEGGFLRSQGTNFFMVAISPDYTISGYTAVSPVSGSTNRVTGTGTMPDPDTGELVGVPNMFVYIGDWYYGDYIGMGITGPDGSYDIGVDINDYTEVVMWLDENYDITNRYVGVFENGGSGGYGGTWIQATLGPDGTVQDFDVIKLNTLVHGQVTAPDGSPVAGASIDIEWTYAGDYYGYYNSSLWHYTDTDENGNYSFWGMNGETVNISVWSQYGDYYEEVNIFSETYDEYIDGYYFNHNIMLMDQPDLPQTELLVNNSFEYYNQDYYSWNNYADDWWSWPTSHNTHIELTGAGIGWDGAVFTAYDGDASLKMWGQYNGDGVDNTTDYYQGFYYDIEPGAAIHASAMMMSHPDDWIGGGSGLNNGQVFVSYFDDYWNFMGTDLSDPVDSSDTAGEWHYRSVIGEVPDGAANVNIGVRYNQVHGSDGSEGHGAIFYDMAQAYTSASDVHTVQIYGMTEQDEQDENGEYIGTAPLPNATIYVWNENYF
ncbi:MAG: hypothetical protein NZ807_13565, partial [Dehalococcoidia bacterium]|nr:hypothetical protein [Dehalococcoidia bacterium]